MYNPLIEIHKKLNFCSCHQDKSEKWFMGNWVSTLTNANPNSRWTVNALQINWQINKPTTLPLNGIFWRTCFTFIFHVMPTFYSLQFDQFRWCKNICFTVTWLRTRRRRCNWLLESAPYPRNIEHVVGSPPNSPRLSETQVGWDRIVSRWAQTKNNRLYNFITIANDDWWTAVQSHTRTHWGTQWGNGATMTSKGIYAKCAWSRK